MPVADRAISTGGELTVRFPRVTTHEGISEVGCRTTASRLTGLAALQIPVFDAGHDDLVADLFRRPLAIDGIGLVPLLVEFRIRHPDMVDGYQERRMDAELP
jgi:hypothetical protein